jgi:hypothetical protein
MVSAYNICDDCASWHANRDLSGVDDPVRVAEVMRCDDYFAVDCGEDGEFCTAFSWSSCDACGTRLGGARHRAWLID